MEKSSPVLIKDEASTEFIKSDITGTIVWYKGIYTKNIKYIAKCLKSETIRCEIPSCQQTHRLISREQADNRSLAWFPGSTVAAFVRLWWINLLSLVNYVQKCISPWTMHILHIRNGSFIFRIVIWLVWWSFTATPLLLCLQMIAWNLERRRVGRS